METTERIVESYCCFVKNWFTIPNVGCAGQNEIDLLAVDLRKPAPARYHLEVAVSVSPVFSKLAAKPYSAAKAKERSHQASQRMTIRHFVEKKFSSETVLERLADFGFAPGNYSRIIVAWGLAGRGQCRGRGGRHYTLAVPPTRPGDGREARDAVAVLLGRHAANPATLREGWWLGYPMA